VTFFCAQGPPFYCVPPLLPSLFSFLAPFPASSVTVTFKSIGACERRVFVFWSPLFVFLCLQFPWFSTMLCYYLGSYRFCCVCPTIPVLLFLCFTLFHADFSLFFFFPFCVPATPPLILDMTAIGVLPHPPAFDFFSWLPPSPFLTQFPQAQIAWPLHG